MIDTAWIGLNARERALLLDALAALSRSRTLDATEIETLALKFVRSAPHPEITIGVQGGQVQWSRGNPFPIRVCDYDAPSDEDLPDIDERGRRCRMWWEPPTAKSRRYNLLVYNIRTGRSREALFIT
jgi:hypothetical protein